ncbi:MAG TPA: hypothetical protein VK666_03770, partial [Chryseolinea sp.]|nr:hypothetical protein [Chryseolinea sp.]
FLDRMGFVFIFCVVGMVIITLYENRKGIVPNGLHVDKSMFKLHPSFLAGSLIVVGLIAALYTIFW